MKFRTKILTAGKTATGIEVPAEIVEALGAGKRPPVRVTLNRYSYRSTIAVMGGRYMVGVSAKVRDEAGVAGGDVVLVDVALDTETREVDVPADFRRVLNKTKALAKLFDSLSYSNQKRLVVPIASAKTPATRERNIDKAVALLRSGELRPAVSTRSRKRA
jgi:hypothetical protein